MLVAVTGADGFIGSHLVEHLLATGCEVVALVQYNSFDGPGWLDGLQGAEGLDIWYGDVRDRHQMEQFLRNVDVVYHLAALISVPYSFQAPRQFVDTNVIGTLNVAQVAADHGIKLVHVSTSEVYGTAVSTPMDEKHRINPQSPYAASKVAADAMVTAMVASHALNATIVRPFNTYGPRQSQRAAIPRIIAQFLDPSGVVRIGASTPRRDFVYVTDTAKGIAAARNIRNIGPYNLATGVAFSIGEVVATLGEKYHPGWRDRCVTNDPRHLRPEAAEVQVLLGDATMMRLMTGWEPQVSFSKGLDTTYEWFKENGIKCARGLI